MHRKISPNSLRFATIAGLPSRMTDVLFASDICAPVLKDGRILIRADCKWNDTGIDVTKGASYQITATGHWIDAKYERSAQGYRSDDPDISRFMRPFFRFSERWRRKQEANWFSLICSVNRDENNWIDVGDALAQSQNGIATITAPDSGRLYCTANDLPFMYWNNKGALLLELKPD